MRRQTRQPTSLAFKGLVCSDENLVVHTRMQVVTDRSRTQQVGPLLMCRIPWSALYDSEIADWLHHEHARRLAVYDAVQAAENLAAQDPLF